MKKSFLALGVFLETIFLSFYFLNYLRASWGVDKLFLEDNRVFIPTFVLLAIALIVQYFAGQTVAKYKISYKYVFWFSVVFNLSLLFIWNFASNDLYTHIQRGRMLTKYGASPYSSTYDQFNYDEFYQETRTVWSGQLSIYGPAFTLFGAFISKLASDSLLNHIIIYKLLYSVFNVLVGYFIYKITKSAAASLIYAWNPLVIFEIQMNNHFEVLTVFPMIFALYLFVSKISWKRFILGLSVLTLGTLTKFFSLIIYPFFVLYAIKKLKTLKEKLLFLFFAGLIQLGIVFFAYLPFMDNLGLGSFLRLANGTFITPSLAMLILIKLFEVFRVNIKVAQTVAQWIFKIGYLSLLVKAILQTKFTDNKVFVRTLVIVFALFTLVYLNLILPWYTLSLLSLLAVYFGLTKDKKILIMSYFLTIYSFILYIRVI